MTVQTGQRTSTTRHGPRRRGIGLALATACAMLLAGCGDGDTEPLPESDPPDVDESALDETTPEPADDPVVADPDPDDPMDPDDDPLPIFEDGFMLDGLVESFPDVVPLPPGARIISSFEPSWQDSGQWGVATLTELDRDELRDFYTAAFTSDGWQLDDSQDTDLFLMMETTGPDHTVNLITADEGGLTRVDLLVRPIDG